MKKVILVVDDDPQIRGSLDKLLRAEGYDVALAADGEEAIDLFDTGSIDLVLLDLTLPGNGGWEVFGAITASDPFLPIIIITGRENQQDLATLAGVGALMEKPLNLPVLLETIRKLILEDAESHLKRLVGLHGDLCYVPPTDPGNVNRRQETR